MSPQSLSEAELERVREILDRFGDKRAMNLEQIDGFLAALVCGPEDIPQSEYLPEIWGDDTVNEAAFARQPILQNLCVSYNASSGCNRPHSPHRCRLHPATTPK